ncbi:MAG TPA: CsgG/HfaB family protein [Bryobacteraceae bacterium]|nr:CsgG/HfaB family protein [Bryobacteraceae bacterium]
MRKVLILLGLVVVGIASVAAQPPPQKRIAIFNFDYSTVHSNVSAIFGTNQDIGKGIADILVDRLVNDHIYTVIERKSMDKLLTEQNFSNSDRADANTAAKLGRLLGVDAIVIGSITQFGRDDKKSNYGGGGFGLNKYGIGGVGRRESKAIVGISARLVAVETGQILATASGTGESARSGTSLLGTGGGPIGGGVGGVDMQSANFGSTLLGEAVGKAVTTVAKQLETNASALPTRAVKLQGLVADVSGNTLIINIGARAGAKVGDRLQVVHPVKSVKDPATGRVIRSVENKLGDIVLTDVDDLSAVGQFTGSGPVKVGDVVKN